MNLTYINFFTVTRIVTNRSLLPVESRVANGIGFEWNWGGGP